MVLKNKEEVIEQLSVDDCPTLEVEGSYTIKKMPTVPFAVLNEVPNYIVVNDDTDKIEFTSDSISLCRHFMAFSNSKQPNMAEGLFDESGGPTLN